MKGDEAAEQDVGITSAGCGRDRPARVTWGSGGVRKWVQTQVLTPAELFPCDVQVSQWSSAWYCSRCVASERAPRPGETAADKVDKSDDTSHRQDAQHHEDDAAG